jgi:hypothetical protein
MEALPMDLPPLPTPMLVLSLVLLLLLLLAPSPLLLPPLPPLLMVRVGGVKKGWAQLKVVESPITPLRRFLFLYPRASFLPLLHLLPRLPFLSSLLCHPLPLPLPLLIPRALPLLILLIPPLRVQSCCHFLLRPLQSLPLLSSLCIRL